ncbi:hypothetical protein D3C71_1213000 [compost metagenome]
MVVVVLLFAHWSRKRGVDVCRHLPRVYRSNGLSNVAVLMSWDRVVHCCDRLYGRSADSAAD